MGCYIGGRNLHHEVALEMYGEGYSGQQYIRAKAVNFGIAYGRSHHSLMTEFGISEDEAKDIIRKWFRRAPRAASYIKNCRRAPFKGVSLVNPFGRHRRFGLIVDKNANQLQNEASNFPIQSTASDLTLLSAMHMLPELNELDAFVVNVVHDSVLIEAPDRSDVIRKAIKIAKETMIWVPTEYLRSKVPFDADAKIGRCWGKMEKLKD
jgi:DNA polymerase-1